MNRACFPNHANVTPYKDFPVLSFPLKHANAEIFYLKALTVYDR